MQRWMFALVIAFVAIGGAIAFTAGGVGTAQSDSDAIVGTWRRVAGAGGGPTQFLTFFADGNVIINDGDGVTWQGAWAPVGDDQVAYTAEALSPEGNGMGQSLTFTLGEDTDSIPFGADVLTRVVPDETS